jgi:hypothetical protein
MPKKYLPLVLHRIYIGSKDFKKQGNLSPPLQNAAEKYPNETRYFLREGRLCLKKEFIGNRLPFALL